jgi:hypothetical protein
MNTKKMTTAITTGLYSILLLILIACDTNGGMMYGNGSTGMYNWNWGSIFTALAVGFFIGFLVFRKKK